MSTKSLQISKEKLAKAMKIVPEGVINEKQYATYIVKMQEVKDHHLRYYVPKNNPEVEIDCLKFPYYVYKECDKYDLSDDEKAEVKRRVGTMRSLHSKANQHKYKAFGSVQTIREDSLGSKAETVIELFGKYFTLEEVYKIITVDWGIPYYKGALEGFRKSNIDKIKAIQEKYSKDWSGLRLVHKRSRLDELTFLYNDRKQKYLETRNGKDYELLLTTLQNIKREIEGDRVVVDGDINININQTLNIHMQQEILKTLVINDIVVSRVAAKLNIDPIFLMSRLQNSAYSKFTGFESPDEGQKSKEVEYPSKMLYDFDKIRVNNIKRNQEDKKLMKLPEFEEGSEEKRIEEIKKRLKQKIQRKKNQLTEAERSVVEAELGENRVLTKEEKESKRKRPKAKNGQGRKS